jgi:hypothetical protein
MQQRCWSKAIPIVCFVLSSGLPLAAQAQEEQKVGAPPEAMNMRLIGYSDLQAHISRPFIGTATATSLILAITGARRMRPSR